LLQTLVKVTCGLRVIGIKMSSLRYHWRIEDNVNLQNIDTIKNIIMSKLKEKLWCNKDMKDKRKLRNYKEVINPDIEYQSYISLIVSLKNKINIAKIRTNSSELHSELWHWKNPKMPWDERMSSL